MQGPAFLASLSHCHPWAPMGLPKGHSVRPGLPGGRQSESWNHFLPFPPRLGAALPNSELVREHHPQARYFRRCSKSSMNSSTLNRSPDCGVPVRAKDMGTAGPEPTLVLSDTEDPAEAGAPIQPRGPGGELRDRFSAQPGRLTRLLHGRCHCKLPPIGRPHRPEPADRTIKKTLKELLSEGKTEHPCSELKKSTND